MFVHGLSGGVGYALLQLAKKEGAEVYGTASGKNQAGLLQQGAHVFDYRDKGWIAAMRQLGGAMRCSILWATRASGSPTRS